MNEKNYIRLRRLRALGNSLAFFLCRMFPIKKNRIVVTTFEGRGGFGCNPKYIVEEIHRIKHDTEIVWLVNDMGKEFPAYIKKAPYTVWGRAYYMSTARVWIDNYRTHYGVKKRAGQYYLNTNHYTLGVKCTGLWRGAGFSPMARIVSEADSRQMDALVIDSSWCETVMPRAMLYSGRLLKTGSPRCDILYGERTAERQRLRERHGLPLDAKIVMYAPTFREGAKNGVRSVYSEVWTIDFERLLASLAARFGGDWYICLRVHPQLAASFTGYDGGKLAGRIFDESKADDMYELLAGVDCYITDYSSAVFEAGWAKIPAIIYADDIAEYRAARGALYWQRASDGRVVLDRSITPEFTAELPFAIAEDNDELSASIADFDFADYVQRIDRLMDTLGVVFDGQASARVARELLYEEG